MNNDSMKLQMRLAQFLKMARRHRGWTQKQLAKHLGKSLSHVERLESSHSADNTIVRSISDFHKYSELLNFSATDFVAFIEEQENREANSIVQKLVERFRRLDLSVQVDLINFLDQESNIQIKRFCELAQTVNKFKTTQGEVTLANLFRQMAELLNK